MIFQNGGEEDGSRVTGSILNGSLWASYAQETKAALVLLERKLATTRCPR